MSLPLKKSRSFDDMQEFRRRYNLVPLVKQDIEDDITNARTRATVRQRETKNPLQERFFAVAS